jgi:hypothetical protein
LSTPTIATTFVGLSAAAAFERPAIGELAAITRGLNDRKAEPPAAPGDRLSREEDDIARCG